MKNNAFKIKQIFRNKRSLIKFWSIKETRKEKYK